MCCAPRHGGGPQGPKVVGSLMLGDVYSKSEMVVCEALRGGEMRVVGGMNFGDSLCAADAPVPGDIYLMKPARGPECLQLLWAEGGQRLGADCAAGRAGAAVRALDRLTLMGEGGGDLDVLTLEIGGAARGWFVPLSPLVPCETYTLIAARPASGGVPQPDLGCMCMTRGTLIDLARGERQPIETLRPGDMVLTRDRGPMPLRWVGCSTRRAAGPLAPVVIAPGVLGNREELIVSPRHRVLVEDARGPRLIEARALVDDDRVHFRAGGYTDYFHLLLDTQEIVYASGAPVESLHLNPQTLASFDMEARRTMQSALSWEAPRPHRALHLPEVAAVPIAAAAGGAPIGIRIPAE